MKKKSVVLISVLSLSAMSTTPDTAKPAEKAVPVAAVKAADKKAEAVNGGASAKPVEGKALDSAKADAPPSTPPAPPAVKEMANHVDNAAYDPKNYIGVPVLDAAGKLQFVAENASQTHSKENFVMIHVKGIKTRGAKENGRVRVAVWDGPSNYAKEGTKPFRASSHWAKDANNGEMIFKIAGLEKGKQYSFFAHFDKESRGFVKKVLGIPLDPFLFTNAANQGKGKGLTREGLSPPKFESTLVKFENSGQEIEMEF